MFRSISSQILKNNNKVLVLLGPRQIGKTTLLKNTFPEAVYFNLELENYDEIFNSRNLKEILNLKNQISKTSSNIWVLDEVQRLQNPGLVAKIIYDELPEIQLIISGSSALEIKNKVSESLAGRKTTLNLYPLSFQEKLVQKNLIVEGSLRFDFDEIRMAGRFQNELSQAMLFGLYPEIENLQSNDEKISYLIELFDSVILKDIYYLNLVKNNKNLVSLLRLLAYQIGGQVNYTDLADRLNISRSTVLDYIELLKKSFIIFTLPPFTKKRRDEIGKTEKVYFYDLGLRNAIVNEFSPVEFRPNYGSLFENFVITEVLKMNSYYQTRYNLYYWRTKWGSEVDLVLAKDEKQIAIEIKTRTGKITPAFKDTYQDAKEMVLTTQNFESVILKTLK